MKLTQYKKTDQNLPLKMNKERIYLIEGEYTKDEFRSALLTKYDFLCKIYPAANKTRQIFIFVYESKSAVDECSGNWVGRAMAVVHSGDFPQEPEITIQSNNPLQRLTDILRHKRGVN
jgi:hypothetical protein